MDMNTFAAVAAVVLAILGNVVAIAYMSGRLNNRVDSLQSSMDSLLDDSKLMGREQNAMGQRLARMEGRRRDDRGED